MALEPALGQCGVMVARHIALFAVLSVAACSDDAQAPADTSRATDTSAPDTTAPDLTDTLADSTAAATTAPEDTSVAPDTTPDSTVADTFVPDVDAVEDAAEPGPVTVSRTHWRLTFEDDFRGKPTNPTERDDYCFDTLAPQCHVWAGASHDCDLTGVGGAGFYPPTKANMIAAIKTIDPDHDFAAMGDDDVKALYGQLIADRMADLDKCHWTLYEMVNWMATDYQGSWSARFDASQVAVDARGKGTLRLSATYAPVDAKCIFGGQGGDPNCQLHAFQPGELTPGVSYWVDPNPAYPGVYYAPTNGTCPHGGTFSGVNCTVMGFPPNVLEAHGVSYWVDADPRWPGVYYANRTYACRDNIDYAPDLGFRNLTCPILDGGLMSYAMTNTPNARGAMQYQGRFEVKARLPKGVGAFPAAWLMPDHGGWPYDGGEIDIMEARDKADEVYQTFHSGKCYDPATGAEVDATDSADCASKGYQSTHLSKGFTTRQAQADEYSTRDHLFAVEWSHDKLEYFINDTKIGEIAVGTLGTIDSGAPSGLAGFESSNFPTSPFYWILNHSTYVPPDKQAAFVQQVYQVDYVRNYVACGTDPLEYCPDGGVFREGIGCQTASGIAPSPCQPNKRQCVNGGVPAGGRCRVWSFTDGQLEAGVDYWIDADVRWPGVYYAKVGGACPYGGSGEINCELVGLPADVLETGVGYVIDRVSEPDGIFYQP